MAVTLNSSSQFFGTVFGLNHPVTAYAGNLVANGVKLDVGLYTCKAIYKGKVSQIELTCGATSLMKGAVSPALADQNKSIIAAWIMTMVEVVKLDVADQKLSEPMKLAAYVVILNGTSPDANPIPLIKVIRQLTGLSLGPAKIMAEDAKAGKLVTVGSSLTQDDAMVWVKLLKGVGGYADTLPKIQGDGETFTPAPLPSKPITPYKPVKPTSQVILLRDALALGQKVAGTSQGSVYHCVALNARVRVAARVMKGGAISIRAEWQGATQDELKRMADNGMTIKDKYASIHVNAAENNIPYGRVVGGFLVGLGIKWDQTITTASELVVD